MKLYHQSHVSDYQVHHWTYKKSERGKHKDWRQFPSWNGKTKMIIESIDDEHFVVERNCYYSLNQDNVKSSVLVVDKEATFKTLEQHMQENKKLVTDILYYF